MTGEFPKVAFLYSERQCHSPNTNPASRAVVYHMYFRVNGGCVSEMKRMAMFRHNGWQQARDKMCDQVLNAVVKGFVAQLVATDLANNESHGCTTT